MPRHGRGAYLSEAETLVQYYRGLSLFHFLFDSFFLFYLIFDWFGDIDFSWGAATAEEEDY